MNGAAPLAALGTARAKFNENRALLNNHILEAEVAGKAELEQRIADNAKLIDAAARGRRADTRDGGGQDVSH